MWKKRETHTHKIQFRNKIQFISIEHFFGVHTLPTEHTEQCSKPSERVESEIYIRVSTQIEQKNREKKERKTIEIE